MLRVALLLLCCVAGAAGAQDEVVDWHDAAQCVGRVCGVRGTVAAVENDGPSIRLYFDAQRRDVRVLLMRGWMVTWPDYQGETIVATAKVQRFRDHVELIVLTPDNITVLGPEPSPTLEPTPSPGPSPSPGEVEELRQKVRELEQRLRDMENR
jgi:hypothetical protein